jgi:hypothetical protein
LQAKKQFCDDTGLGLLTTTVDVEEQPRREEALRMSGEALLRANEILEQLVQVSR